MSGFILKVKTKGGQELISKLGPSSTLAALKEELSNITNIPANSLSVFYGFPPRNLDLSEEDKTLQNCNIKSGDVIIINEKITQSGENNTESDLKNDGILLRQVVPADNSCLFTSVTFVFSGHVDSAFGFLLREIVALEVSGDPEKYNEAFLGQPNHEYCQWIQNPTSWGGAIELSVLSKYYGVEIAVLNTVSGTINRFGEDQSYDYRAFLIFDGVHYDPLYKELNDAIETMFPTSDEKTFHEAELLVMEAKENHQFTDPGQFRLQCLECNTYLNGKNGAAVHAKETGHTSFGEVHSNPG